MDMQRRTSGSGIHHISAATKQPIAEIARSVSQADDGIAGLMELLELAGGAIATESIAALLRPHAQALKRASAALNDHV
jgi:hypothetical protein